MELSFSELAEAFALPGIVETAERKNRARLLEEPLEADWVPVQLG
jgi:hypothetical protein